ncbi:hypothetical protein BESB_064790 [Besnoitia besnoiti]|uniref:RAP domain-containing protein n=1 Tax=Besnoitia besnoiti TaxID=94643 RepID=A0A2A9M7J2_BESBE|nr:hypothetical protein BESB_064790 [Besnoitia besnoiti]PFH34448.1 hypothetical protein BESB_064790 [Besnoitia besnoiti]
MRLARRGLRLTRLFSPLLPSPRAPPSQVSPWGAAGSSSLLSTTRPCRSFPPAATPPRRAHSHSSASFPSSSSAPASAVRTCSSSVSSLASSVSSVLLVSARCERRAFSASAAAAKRCLAMLKAKPGLWKSLLQDALRAKVADPAFLRLASRRFLDISDEFYPPECLEALELFASVPFSDEPLLAAVTGRLDDLLTDPSPKRLAALMGFYTRLGFSHPLAQNPLTQQLVAKMHAVDVTLLPSLCRHASALFLEPHVPVLDGLSTQAQLLLAAGLATGKEGNEEGKRDLSALFSCLESLSRQRYRHAALIEDTLVCVERHSKVLSLQDSLRAVAAARRLHLAGVEEQLRAQVDQQAERAMERGEELLGLLRLLDRLRLRDAAILQKALDAVELHSQKKGFATTQMPEALLHLARLAPSDLPLLVALLSQPSLVATASSFSVSQVQQLLTASSLILFQHIQRREGAIAEEPLQARAVEALARTAETLLALLQPQYQSLNLREKRAVKEAAALLLLEAQCAPRDGVASLSGFCFAQRGTIPFLKQVEEDDVVPPLSLGPSTVDFRRVELVDACARTVLIADGARGDEPSNPRQKSASGGAQKHTTHEKGAQLPRALLFVAPGDSFAEGSSPGAKEDKVSLVLGGVVTDLPAAVTPQAASSLLITQVALQRNGIDAQDVHICATRALSLD